MIRDRGTKKWTSLMIPEHVRMLRDLNVEYNKQKKPELDEQEIEQLGIIIMESLYYTLPIKLMYWNDGFTYVHQGIVSKVHQLQKFVEIDCDDEGKIILNIDKIILAERV